MHDFLFSFSAKNRHQGERNRGFAANYDLRSYGLICDSTYYAAQPYIVAQPRPCSPFAVLRSGMLFRCVKGMESQNEAREHETTKFRNFNPSRSDTTSRGRKPAFHKRSILKIVFRCAVSGRARPAAQKTTPDPKWIGRRVSAVDNSIILPAGLRRRAPCRPRCPRTS